MLELTRADRHRRAVRRQVLLPRRARDPAAAARRVVPGRDRRVVLGRPAGARRRSPPRACSSSSSRRDPAQFLPETTDEHLDDDVVQHRPQPADGRDPRRAVRATRCKTRLSLTGPLVVARDIAHAKIKERLDAGEPMPQYLRDHARLLRRPGQDARGLRVRARSGRRRPGGWTPTSTSSRPPAARSSCSPRATGRKPVTDACQQHGGFYLGSIGGPAARLAQDCIKKVEVLEYAELGMEAVWRIEVEDFPAFVVVDDKGNDFFAETRPGAVTIGRRSRSGRRGTLRPTSC